MQGKIGKFFDYNGELGRLDFIKKSLTRGLIFLPFVFIPVLFDYIFDSPAFMTTDWTSESIQNYMYSVTLDSQYFAVISLAFFLPIAIKRIRDLEISFWWIVIFEILVLMPEPLPLEDETLHTGGLIYGSILLCYLLFRIYLICAPGKISKNLRKQKRKDSFKGSNKVTFSE